MLSSLVYIGCFFGFVSISFLVDNLGRRRVLLIALVIAIIGMIMVAVSPNIYVVGVGLFIMGMGSDFAINICLYFIT